MRSRVSRNSRAFWSSVWSRTSEAASCRWCPIKAITARMIAAYRVTGEEISARAFMSTTPVLASFMVFQAKLFRSPRLPYDDCPQRGEGDLPVVL